MRANEELCLPCVEAKRAYMRNWQEKNREKVRAKNNACAAKYRDRRQAYSKRYRAENTELLRAKNRQYHYDHPDKTREKRRRRRAAVLKNGFEYYTEAQVLDLYGTTCYLCNHPIDLDAPRTQGRGEGWELGLHIDHVIPIVSDGPDTLDNVRPTHALCNLSKNDKPIERLDMTDETTPAVEEVVEAPVEAAVDAPVADAPAEDAATEDAPLDESLFDEDFDLDDEDEVEDEEDDSEEDDAE